MSKHKVRDTAKIVAGFNRTMLDMSPMLSKFLFSFVAELGSDRLGERAPNAPAKAKASAYQVTADSGAASPFGYAQRLAVEGQESSVSPVSCLLGAACPAGIFWAVVAIVVDTLKRSPVWLRPDIGKEIHERRPPAVAYFDAAAAVVRVRPDSSVCASGKHPFPRFVFGGFFKPARHPVLEVRVPVAFHGSPDAATRRSVATRKIAPTRVGCLPAIAAALPKVSALLFASVSDNSQHSAPLGSAINKPWHRNLHQRSSEKSLGRTVMSRLFGSEPSRELQYTTGAA